MVFGHINDARVLIDALMSEKPTLKAMWLNDYEKILDWANEIGIGSVGHYIIGPEDAPPHYSFIHVEDAREMEYPIDETGAKWGAYVGFYLYHEPGAPGKEMDILNTTGGWKCNDSYFDDLDDLLAQFKEEAKSLVMANARRQVAKAIDGEDDEVGPM
jgi:hypothetical protein